MRLRENGFLLSVYLLGFWDSCFSADLFLFAETPVKEQGLLVR